MRLAYLHITVVHPMTSATDGIPAADEDVDVSHDRYGCPVIPRNRLAARLRDGCLEAVRCQPTLLDAARRLFGAPGAHDDAAILAVGDATLPDPVRKAIRYALSAWSSPGDPPALTTTDVLDGFTTIIRSTAVDATGGPRPTSLRRVRAVLPDVPFVSQLTWHGEPTTTDLACLARAVLGVQQIGLGGTRGRGTVVCALASVDQTTGDDLAWTRQLADPPEAAGGTNA